MDKRCAICGEVKPVSEFHRMENQKGGYRSQCKTCRQELQKMDYQKNKDAVLERTKAYAKDHREQGRKSFIKWQRSEKGKTFYKTYTKPPEQDKASRAVNHAVENGRMPSVRTFICSVCREKQAEHYHHHKGYEQRYWLDVIPVCALCHKIIEGR